MILFKTLVVFFPLIFNAIAEVSVTCPPLDGPDAIYFSDPTDCSRFYECSNGVPYLFECPAGLDFNPELNVCDYPEQAGCRGRTSTGTSPSPTTSENGDDDTSNGSNSSESNSSSNESNDSSSSSGDSSNESNENNESSDVNNKIRVYGSDGGECVVDEQHYSVRADSSDCNKYLKCFMGRNLVKLCPKQYHFDPNAHICMPPSFAKCVINN